MRVNVAQQRAEFLFFGCVKPGAGRSHQSIATSGEQHCQLYVTGHSATDRNIQFSGAKAIIAADP
jgi:hypothetical protein